MKEYFVKYKPFLLFLGKFLLAYAVLTFLYQCYLSQYDKAAFEVDGFTKSVASQTESLICLFNKNVAIAPHEAESSIKLFYENKFVARVVEGCNGLSVIILFAAFIIAFTGKWKTTVLYILGGSLLIHILNIIRIAILGAVLYEFPQQEDFLHGVVFPLFIYGVVFILWVIWVNKFSSYAEKPVQK